MFNSIPAIMVCEIFVGSIMLYESRKLYVCWIFRIKHFGITSKLHFHIFVIVTYLKYSKNFQYMNKLRANVPMTSIFCATKVTVRIYFATINCRLDHV